MANAPAASEVGVDPAEKTEQIDGPVESGLGVALADGITPEQTFPAEPSEPETGAITVSTHDNTTVYRWAIGSAPNALSVEGQRRALEATADYLGRLPGSERDKLASVAGGPHYRVTPNLWEIPALPGHGEHVASVMTEVIDRPGSLGRTA